MAFAAFLERAEDDLATCANDRPVQQMCQRAPQIPKAHGMIDSSPVAIVLGEDPIAGEAHCDEPPECALIREKAVDESGINKLIRDFAWSARSELRRSSDSI